MADAVDAMIDALRAPAPPEAANAAPPSTRSFASTPTSYDELTGLPQYTATPTPPASPPEPAVGPSLDASASGTPDDVDQMIAALRAPSNQAAPISNMQFLANSAIKGLNSSAAPLADAANIEMGNFDEPPAPDWQTAARALGSDPNAQPSNEAIRLTGAGIQGLTAAAPLAPFAAAGGVAGIAPFILSGAGSGVGGEAASDLGYGTFGQLAGGMAGGAIGGGLGSLTNLGSAALAHHWVPSSVPGAVDLGNAGIPLNSGMRAGLLGADEFGNTPMGAYQQPAKALSDQLLGTTPADQATPSAIGQQVMQKSSAWVQQQKDDATKAFSQFAGKVPPTTNVQPIETPQLLGASAASNGPPEPPIYAQLRTALDSSGGNISYGDLKAWRGRVGQLIDDNAVNPQGFNPELKQLYGSLSNDMEGTVYTQSGQDGLDAFRTMNRAYASSQDFIDTHLGKLANESLTPEKVWNSLAANPARTASSLQALKDRGVIDDTDLNLIARQQLFRMGYNTDGGFWDADMFAKNTAKLDQTSPEAQKLLFGRGDTTQAYDSLAKTAQTMHRVNSPLAQGAGETGRIGSFIKQALPMAMIGAGHIAGGEAGAMVGGSIGEGLVGGERASAGNALFRLGQKPWFSSMLTKQVLNQGKAVTYLMSQQRFHPDSADDLQTIINGIQGTENTEAQ